MQDYSGWGHMKKNKPRTKSHSPGEGAPQKMHFSQIDILKGLAIISVILIHTFTNSFLLLFGAPFYVWQAVPVFLLLAAFNNGYALSSLRKVTLAECYDLSILFRRLKRLVVPYLVVWIIQLLIVLWVVTFRVNIPIQDANQFSYSGIQWFFNFLSGANGPGHYFIPLIVQIIVLVPLFYWLALRSPNLMLAGAFVLDLVCEYLSVLSGMTPWLYGILVIRFIFIIALGVWLVFQERVMTPWILIGGFLSVLYITAVSYFGFQFWIFSLDPAFFHAFAFFWALVIVVLGFQYLPSGSLSRIVTAVTELGKASWHIFLVQMTFFFFVGASIHAELSPGPVVFLAVFCQLANLSIGYGFYRLEDYVIKQRKRSSS